MAFSKYWFEQHRKWEEGKKYEASSEKKELDFNKCKHKDVKIDGNTLKCSCGAVWQGAGIDKLQKILTKWYNRPMAAEEKKETPQEEVKLKEAGAEESSEQPKEQENKKRTKKQFKKLKKSNKELKQERDEYKSVIDSLKPQPPQSPPPPPQEQKIQDVPTQDKYSHLKQDQIDDVFSGMMDEQGYVDANKLFGALRGMNQKIQQAEQRAVQAEQKASQAGRNQRDFEETSEVRKVHRKYPQVDPKSDDFDSELFDAVRNELIGQMMDGKRDFMAATKKWHGRIYAGEEMATKKEKAEQTKKEEAKAQINATAPKSSTMSGYYQDSDMEGLIEDTKKGKKGALAERLRRSGHGP